MTGKEIKALRRRLGISARQLGEALGVTRNTVARWEIGWRECRGPAVLLMKMMAKDHKTTSA